MDFELSEQHKMLGKTMQDFAAKEIALIAAEFDRSGEFPWDCVKKMAGLGFFGILTPPPFGGTGPDKLGFFIAIEEIAAASASVAVALLYNNSVNYADDYKADKACDVGQYPGG